MPDRWTPPASDRTRPRSLSLSPSLPHRCLVGQACRRQTHPHAHPFSRCPVGPPCQQLTARCCAPSLVRGPRLSATPLVPNLPPSHPTMDVPMSHVSQPPPHTPNLLLEPTPTHSPPPRLVAPAAEHYRPLSRSARAHGVPPLLVVVSLLFYGRHRALAALVASVSSTSSSATRDTPRFTPTRCLPMQPEPCHRRPKAS